jgi:hypothetical protein
VSGPPPQSSPLVSVVIPTHNRAALLVATLASALEQTLRDIEVIVVDDGCTDKTSEVVAAVARRDSRVHLLSQTNTGLAAARNTGLAVASAPLVAFLDDDDLWLPSAMAELTGAIGTADVVACLCARFFSDSPTLRAKDVIADQNRFTVGLWPEDASHGLVSLAELIVAPRIPIHAALFRRSALLALGGFDPIRRAAEDYQLWLHLAARAPVNVLASTLALYRWHPCQMRHDRTRQSRETRLALESFLTSCPQGRQAVTTCALRRRLAGLHREEAYESLLAGESLAAARAALASLRYWPFKLKTWAYLLASAWPTGFRRRRRGYKPCGDTARQ